MTVRLVSLDELTPEDIAMWDSLSERAVESNPFIDPAFLIPTAKAWPEASGLRLAVLSEGEQWNALLAFTVEHLVVARVRIPVMSLTGAFLPELATAEGMGKVSGWGWGFGYIGGMLALGMSLAYVLWAQARGLPASHFVPVTMLITAALYGAAACVTFALLPERARPQMSAQRQSAWRQLRSTFREARAYRDFMWLLASTVFYQGGVAVAITLAAVYAEQVIGFAQHETMALIFVLNVAAAAGAFAFGYVQDRVGHLRSLSATLVAWIVVCVVAASVTTKGGFWVAATIAGLAMGSSQSAGRAMAGILAPPTQLAEFFGLWSFATRLASIIGPLSYGAITWATGGNQRIAILSTSILFVVGIALLAPIDMRRGRAAALASA